MFASSAIDHKQDTLEKTITLTQPLIQTIGQQQLIEKIYNLQETEVIVLSHKNPQQQQLEGMQFQQGKLHLQGEDHIILDSEKPITLQTIYQIIPTEYLEAVEENATTISNLNIYEFIPKSNIHYNTTIIHIDPLMAFKQVPHHRIIHTLTNITPFRCGYVIQKDRWTK